MDTHCGIRRILKPDLHALAGYRPGEIVVDLGCGTGTDALRAAQSVGPGGKVYGLDQSPLMLRLAGVQSAAVKQAEWIHASVESIPLRDRLADKIISNCVLVLLPDKQQALHEASRVLKTGGRLIVSDYIRVKKGGNVRTPVLFPHAQSQREYTQSLKAAGFSQIRIIRPIRTRGAGVFSVPGYVLCFITARKQLTARPKHR